MTKQLWSWLRMKPDTGDYPVSESAGVYNANLNNIDAALPINGGRLEPDGSWVQWTGMLAHEWPQSLPETAANVGHLYMPVMSNTSASIQTVLDDPGLQQTAADNVVNLALYDRFDSPWDGVYLDLESIPSSHRTKLNDFLYLLSYEIRRVGLQVGVSVRGRTDDDGPDGDKAYTYDFSVIAQIADVVDIRCYGYRAPAPVSMAPHWYSETCIKYALSKGIPPQHMLLGIGSFAKYWPVTGVNTAHLVVYDQAIQIMQNENSFVQWIERNENGLVREKYADVGGGHIWFHDGDTLRHNLNLSDKYNLLGCAHFIAGMGDEYHWQVIEDWRGQ